MLSHDALLESLLFYRGEPIKKKELEKLLELTSGEVTQALAILKERLQDGGITLVEYDEKVSLGTNPQASNLIEKITKEELTKDLGKAGLETLSIVLYKGLVSRREIEYIRGVNSSFILRNLLIRGLIERQNDTSGRGYVYKASGDLLMHLGVGKIEELPGYSEIKAELETFGESEENREE